MRIAYCMRAYSVLRQAISIAGAPFSFSHTRVHVCLRMYVCVCACACACARVCLLHTTLWFVVCAMRWHGRCSASVFVLCDGNARLLLCCRLASMPNGSWRPSHGFTTMRNCKRCVSIWEQTAHSLVVEASACVCACVRAYVRVNVPLRGVCVCAYVRKGACKRGHGDHLPQSTNDSRPLPRTS